jgi:hypothetical protein
LGAEGPELAERLRRARDAEFAHLAAVLKVHGAAHLRLAHLRDALIGDLELKANAGEEPQLWLDVAHRVTMEPDAKTYCLKFVGSHSIDALLQTERFEEARMAAQNVLDHQTVQLARASARPVQPGEVPELWSKATLFYVWFTGLVTGAAALAMISIYLKKLPF